MAVRFEPIDRPARLVQHAGGRARDDENARTKSRREVCRERVGVHVVQHAVGTHPDARNDGQVPGRHEIHEQLRAPATGGLAHVAEVDLGPFDRSVRVGPAHHHEARVGAGEPHGTRAGHVQGRDQPRVDGAGEDFDDDARAWRRR